jgi:uncharacterized membrane protein
MTSLKLLLLGHILGTAILVGGAFMLQVLAVLAARSPTAADLAALSRQAAWIGPRVFLPAAALIAATGAGLASRLDVALGEPFVLVGLAVILVAAATGPGYLAPEARRISRLVAAQGPGSAEARRRLRRLFLASRVELLLLIVAVAAMVAGPAVL